MSGAPHVSNSFVSPYSNPFVSQSGWWCPALQMPPIEFFPLIATDLSPGLAGGVRLSGCLQLICFPFRNRFVSQSGWCPALRMSPSHLSPLVATRLSPSLAGGVQLPDVSKSFSFLYSNSSVSQSGWWCPALRLSPLAAIHLSASLAGGVGLSACLQLICLPLLQFICFQVLLVVAGFPHVSNLFVSP